MNKQRWALIAAQLLCLFAVAGLAAWTVASADRHGAVSARLQAQMNSVLALGGASGNYQTQLAQVLLLGREQQADLRTARLGMERHFIILTQAWRDQAVYASDPGEMEVALAGVENARRMLELYHAIDLAASRAIVLDRDGQQPESRYLYEREIDFRLSTEFAALLDRARLDLDERLQTTRADADVARNQLTAMWAAAIIASLLVQGFTAATLVRLPPASTGAVNAAFEARTAELRDSNKRLRENDEKRAQFLADVSHELRTPLTILRGEADVAMLPGAGAIEQRRALERIQGQAAEMSELLDDLIAFARSDAEQQPLQLSPVLLDDLLAAAVQEGETLAEPREVTLDLHLDDRIVWVEADPRRFKQALLIGIDNAVNHSPPGTVIRIRRELRDGNACVVIADQGPGIAERDQPHVFDRFFRGNAGKGSSFGLGIGLAIAKAIVEQHHGTIALSNNAHTGAELMITLPVLKDTPA